MRITSAIGAVILAALIVPAAVAAPLPFSFGGPFALTDHNGKPRTDRDFRGRWLLVYFGYASCRSRCPLDLHRMAAALDALDAESARIQPLFITVDPARDTISHLRHHLPKIHPRLIGLTGSPAALRAAARAYGVRSRILTPPDEKDAIIAHGSYIYLMKPDGGFATLIPPVTPPEEMAQIVHRYIAMAKVGKGGR